MSSGGKDSREELLTTKLRDLETAIARRGSMLGMYSGGVDSTLLAVVAHRILGRKFRCALLDSPLIPRREVQDALEQANREGFSCRTIHFPILADEVFRAHPVNRCYLCRKHASALLRGEANHTGMEWIADGLTTSDLGTHRPGIKAADEAGIIHPFIEAAISKDDVRGIAKMLGLGVWNKPSAACLASRIPYGDRLDEPKLGIIERAEDILHQMGFPQVRVRLHGPVMRIEVPMEELEKILAMRSVLVEKLKQGGGTFITLDLEGFRSGSMDEVG